MGWLAPEIFDSITNSKHSSTAEFWGLVLPNCLSIILFHQTVLVITQFAPLWKSALLNFSLRWKLIKLLKMKPPVTAKSLSAIVCF